MLKTKKKNTPKNKTHNPKTKRQGSVTEETVVYLQCVHIRTTLTAHSGLASISNPKLEHLVRV